MSTLEQMSRDELEERVETLEEEQEELLDTVEFLRDAVFNLQDMVVGEDRQVSFYEANNESLVDQLESLKRGEVDTTDLVGGVDPELPIEEDLAKANDETRRTDLSTNELRAVYVFKEFGSESKSWSGMMTLDSADVRRILQDNGEGDLNDNDPRRTMRMLAKKSADLPREERDPQHEENLFTLSKGDKRLELQADKEEFVDFWQGMEERYSP